MAGWRVKSIRGKTTLVATLGTLCAMVAVVAIVAFSTQYLFKSMLADNLMALLDKAQEHVEDGDFDSAVLGAGSGLLQVIDADGNVLASSANATGLAPIVEPNEGDGKTERREVPAPNLRQEGEKGQQGAAGPDANGAAGGTGGAPGEGSGEEEPAPDADGGGADASGGAAAPSRNAKGRDDGEPAGSGQDKSTEERKAQQDDDAPSSAQRESQRQPSDDEGARGAESQSKPLAPNNVEKRGLESGAGAADGGGNAPAESGGLEGGAQRGSVLPASLFRAGLVRIACAKASESASQAESIAQGEDAYVDASSVLGDDGPYLVMDRSVESPNATVTLAAMVSLAPAIRSAQATAQVLAVVLLALLAAVALFAWTLSARTLRPVTEMSEQAEAITAGDLSTRIAVPDGDKDLSHLANTLNDLLGRIEESVDEQKRFMSDASHELKSPVAATRIMLETLRDYPDSLDRAQVIDDLSAENERISHVVGDMLLLARQDENRMSVEKLPVDLFDLLREEAASLGKRSDVEVDCSGVEPVICDADAELLCHAVRNLLDNAARYAVSRVRLSCALEGARVRITVSDDGPGIPPQDRERVFDRFVRLEDSRSRKQGSTGLGLAVVKGIIERHGGTVTFEDPEIGGATACIQLPES